MSSSTDKTRFHSGDVVIEQNSDGKVVIRNVTDGESIELGAPEGVSTGGHGVWHAGNFDPATVAKRLEVDSFAGADDDEIVDAAIAAADPGDTLVFSEREYTLAANRTITKAIDLEGNNTRISIPNTGGSPTFEFEGPGLDATVMLSSAVSAGETVIPVADTAPFAVGDTVRLSDQEWANDAHKFDFGHVQAIDSTAGTLTLDRAITYDYDGTNGRVAPASLLDPVEVSGFTFDCTGGSGGSVLSFHWCKKPVHRDTTIERYMVHSGWFRDCWEGVSEDVSVETALGTGSGEGYAHIFYRCQDSVLRSPKAGYCRHGIDFSNGTHSCEVTNPTVGDAQLAGVHLHHEIGPQNAVRGGVVHANTGLAHRRNCEGFVVDGTTIYADSTAINAYDGFTAANLTVYKSDTGADNAIHCYGDDIHIEGSFHSSGGNTWADGVYLDSTSDQTNVTLEIDSADAFGRVGRITGSRILSDLTISGRHIGTTSGSGGVTLRVDSVTLDGWDCEVTARGWDDGIVAYSGATCDNVRFSGCDIESATGDSIRFGASANTNISAVGNRFRSGFSLGANTTNATVVGNVGAVSIDANATNTYSDGNV